MTILLNVMLLDVNCLSRDFVCPTLCPRGHMMCTKSMGYIVRLFYWAKNRLLSYVITMVCKINTGILIEKAATN